MRYHVPLGIPLFILIGDPMSFYIEITEPNPKRHTHNCRIRVNKSLVQTHDYTELGSLLRAVEVAAWNAYKVGDRVEVSLIGSSGELVALRKIFPQTE